MTKEIKEAQKKKREEDAKHPNVTEQGESKER